MRLRDHVQKELIFTRLEPRDKTELFQILARRMERFFPRMDAGELFIRLEEREAQATTGIGQGVGVPHARVAGLEKTICAVAQIPDGLEFNSLDGKKVTCVFLLVSPVEAMGRHIKVLARIARLANHRGFIGKINRAETADEIHQLIMEEDSRHVD